MAYADLSVLIEDCDELHLRLRQVLHRHPERAVLIAPGLERTEDMRRRILKLREHCERAKELFVKWREEFDKG
jgi:hypothetical protein